MIMMALGRPQCRLAQQCTEYASLGVSLRRATVQHNTRNSVLHPVVEKTSNTVSIRYSINSINVLTRKKSLFLEGVCFLAYHV